MEDILEYILRFLHPRDVMNLSCIDQFKHSPPVISWLKSYSLLNLGTQFFKRVESHVMSLRYDI